MDEAFDFTLKIGHPALKLGYARLKLSLVLFQARDGVAEAVGPLPRFIELVAQRLGLRVVGVNLVAEARDLGAQCPVLAL